MKPIFEYTKGMTDVPTHYCPGCTHGIAHRIIMEVLEEMGELGNTIGVAPIGCSVTAHEYMNVDMCEAAHGRAPAVASGIRRVHPDKVVFTYQGDGDLASIGTGEIVHAAVRGEKFSTFFINNGIYGMTGGQMAPTTLIGQKSTTSQDGRSKELNGMPVKMSEMLASIDGAAYVERVALDSPAHIRQAKKAVRRAFGPWPQDVARHSYASYAYEECKDAVRVASEMGHAGTEVFFRHYRALAAPGSSAEYFAILPP